MTPGPNIAIDLGKFFSSNSESVVKSRSWACDRNSGKCGREPVAITILLAITSVWSETCKVFWLINFAWPTSLSCSLYPSMVSRTKPTNADAVHPLLPIRWSHPKSHRSWSSLSSSARTNRDHSSNESAWFALCWNWKASTSRPGERSGTFSWFAISCSTLISIACVYVDNRCSRSVG